MLGGNIRDAVIQVSAVLSLEGTLAVPDNAAGIVVFAHGSGSGRFSPRNRNVARALNGAGLATLLFDLLSAAENERDAQTAEYRFDIPLLAMRLTHALDWLADDPDVGDLPIRLFGASTGAAAALTAAAIRPGKVRAVVSRGGRPDLAGAALEWVRAPTLLIVGGDDTPVIALNRQAARHLHCVHQLAIVPGATHLFEEAGTLDEVTRLAADWFQRYAVTQPALAKSGF